MLEPVRDQALRLLKVPTEPHPPAGDPAKLRVFRAAPNYWRYRLVVWGLRQFAGLLGLVAGLVGLYFLMRGVDVPYVVGLWQFAEAVGVLAFLVQIPFSLAVLRLDYELRWYLVSDRSLRIREGVLSVREQTMTFANVQQVGIRQGPLQRLLGIADVHVRTAGGGSGGMHGEEAGAARHMHEGFLRGVANAVEIRDAIRERVRLHRDAGLGDPDDPGHAPAGTGEPALTAAREVLDEVRALRGALRPERAAARAR